MIKGSRMMYHHHPHRYYYNDIATTTTATSSTTSTTTAAAPRSHQRVAAARPWGARALMSCCRVAALPAGHGRCRALPRCA